MKKIAAIQMTSSMDLPANLAMAEALLQEAAHEGADLAVLPEMFPQLGKGESFTPDDGTLQEFLSTQSMTLGMWIIGGTIPMPTENPAKNHASTLVYNDQGKMVARYDKMNLFDACVTSNEAYNESDSITRGTKLTVIETPVGKIGLGVCFDIRFPEMFREMLAMGAEIFAIPAAFTVPTGQAHWEVLTRALAVQNFAYVIGAAQFGTHGGGRQTHGDSLIIAPSGDILARLPEGPGVITADIDLEQVQTLRAHIPIIPA